MTLAIFGYHWIHTTQKWLMLLFLVTFGVFSVMALFVVPLDSAQYGFGDFSWPAFLIQFGAAAAYGLGWAPYVSDYSRYLPPQTSATKATAYTYGGVFVGGSWLMLLGAFIAAALTGTAPLEGVRDLANQVVPGSGSWLLLAALPGLISVITVNIYAAAMELITIADSIRPVTPTRGIRVLACVVVGAAAFIGNMLSTGSFLDSFGAFLVILLYILVPWTSVNLVDYYFVRRGTYAIREIFDRNGIYGTWGTRGLIAYFIGIVAMIPFAMTSWYTGPIAEALGGVDLALFVGLAASGVSYLVLARGIDLDHEWRLSDEHRRLYGEHAVAFGAPQADTQLDEANFRP